ncbi:tRNA pseudouridine(38-40) synthase [Aphanomyces invadans]|uniref:tRNA pseudouridine(38-40) synthase n=1 Tax=Aphanomyces invadans TaxID=157072 RepID=A0A024U417_9STRA|nr:tRNA pseudouridine(38-40) synthase [Aphanomyces invadans]ETW00950.1 tRNA pseudouridine(38-40) synthase [Aphanomyces invadans]|eukprot:XP_008869948.1 tRNA pseudouridine(38-40) synthase [Aphanomyces invadans]
MMLLRRPAPAMRPFLGAMALSMERRAMPQGESGKKRKVKVALVTGYTGTGYHGVQIQENVNVPTVEHAVREALFKAGCILESNYGDMSKIGWSRSSRTDKGVHASSIVLSGKLLVHGNRIDPVSGRIAHLPDQINAYLPQDIRVFTATKVHQSFRAREDCILREYEYFLPLSFLSSLCPPEISADDALKTFLETLPKFEGIHDFHNFTKQRRHFYKLEAQKLLAKERRRQRNAQDEVVDDATPDEEVVENEGDDIEAEPNDISLVNGVRKTLQRHSRSIYACRGALVPDVFGEPFIHIHLTGGSFLFNQIRCMVGGAIAVATGAMAPTLFDAALRTNHVVHVPTAPAEGLVLSSCGFGAKQHLISLLRDHNTPRNLFAGSNPNQAPHRVLVSDTEDELHRMLQFRNEVIYKEVVRMWHVSEHVAAWPTHFASWTEKFNETTDERTLRVALEKVLADDASKAAYSDRIVREARVIGDAVKVLPRAFSTVVCIHFGITPGAYIADAIAGLKLRILDHSLPVDATQEDLLDYMSNIGLDTLARMGRTGM